jgi:hypothetical protein
MDENRLSIAGLTDDEHREDYRLAGLYWREALRCEGAKAYLAGCAMLAASLEAWLILKVDAASDEALANGKAPMRKGSVKPLLEWGLSDLLRVAKSAGRGHGRSLSPPKAVVFP